MHVILPLDMIPATNSDHIYFEFCFCWFSY